MRHKYINTKILLACLAKKPAANNDIHTQLQETIAEHRRIMQRFWQTFSREQEEDFAILYKIAA